MKINLKTTQNQTIIIDEEDKHLYNLYKWHAVKNKGRTTYYVYSNRYVNGKRTTILLHRLIMNILNKSNKLFIDHIDGNGLNISKDNLRIVNRNQNLMNSKKRINTKSKYKGVTFYKRNNK